MLSGCALNRAFRSRPKSKLPIGAVSDLFCCHTKKSVEPGRYSHRTTALPRSARKLKSGSKTLNDAAGPEGPSGSIVYLRVPSTIVELTWSPVKACSSFDRGRTYSLNVT